ncbi:MAG: excinuclease ABC subunit UvrC [Deferribacteres bacterium]|nr:excinuclease ABC subunit UvrC [Deferribacteres bacterium]
MKEFLKEEIRKSPASPGVYLFKDGEGRILYVGKAKNLSHRLKSYLSNNLPYKTKKMLELAEHVEVITTDSELDAFILESNLIKTHQPPFNVLLKDDKHYPYIRIDVSDPFPYLEITRRVKNDHALYYGPYVPTWAVRETLKVVTQAFPIRRCTQNLAKSRSKRPCLNFQIKRCLAPCSGNVTREEYRKIVDKVVELLEGKGEELIKRLEEEMYAASERLEFEKAARLRDQIFSVKKILERQKSLLTEKIDMDVLATECSGNQTALTVLFVRKGMLIGEKIHLFNTSNREEALDAIFREYYLDAPQLPDVIMTYDVERILTWIRLLSEKKRVEARTPWTPQLEELLELAGKKARERLEESTKRRKNTEKLLDEAKRLLGLKKTPHRIEGYDISNTYGKEAVGSMVVFIDGEPSKSDYRRFKIKQVKEVNDYAMHREVLRRRFQHREWELPELVVIDGGYGHLHAAEEVLKEMGIEADVIAISKGEKGDEIWSKGGKIPLNLWHPVMHLIQRVRDESHRFAVSYHRRLRSRESFSSLLESIPGVGVKRKERIMKEVSSLEELKRMSPEELSSKCGIPLNIAEKILENLNH